MALPFLGAALGGLAGGLSGLFGARSANRAAEAEARNVNKQAKYDWRQKLLQYGQQELPGLTRTRKTSTLRDALVAALTRGQGSASGLEKVLGGAGLRNYGSPTYTAPVNIVEQAGPPPEMEAVRRASGMGGFLSGAAGGAAGGAQIQRSLRGD